MIRNTQTRHHIPLRWHWSPSYIFRAPYECCRARPDPHLPKSSRAPVYGRKPRAAAMTCRAATRPNAICPTATRARCWPASRIYHSPIHWPATLPTATRRTPSVCCAASRRAASHHTATRHALARYPSIFGTAARRTRRAKNRLVGSRHTRARSTARRCAASRHTANCHTIARSTASPHAATLRQAARGARGRGASCIYPFLPGLLWLAGLRGWCCGRGRPWRGAVEVREGARRGRRSKGICRHVGIGRGIGALEMAGLGMHHLLGCFVRIRTRDSTGRRREGNCNSSRLPLISRLWGV